MSGWNETFAADRYDSRTESRMQDELAALAPFPVSVVYWQQRDHDLSDMRAHFRAMAAVGITGLKGIHLQDDADVSLATVRHAALDEGLVPWFYGKGGWEPITRELCAELDVDPDLPRDELHAHPAIRAHQERVLRDRIDREAGRPSAADVATGEPPTSGLPFDEPAIEAFADWLTDRYGDLDTLRDAWFEYGSDSAIDSWTAAARIAGTAEGGQGHGDFRRHLDAWRFAADAHAREIEALVEARLTFDPDEPQRTGGHMLFTNHAERGWDLERQATAMATGGSFYNSIHQVHHFQGVDTEVDVPTYVQARLTNDFFKGGWSATWESTGGPAFYSGHRGAGVDAGMIERLFFSYLAGGLRGIGVWCWNPRDVGWELGEYALTDRQGELTPRARRAGAIAQALQRHRFELWEAHNQPEVGVLFSWLNDAFFGRLRMGGYITERQETFPDRPRRAQIGIARALIENHVPFEFVTERDLAAGLAARYGTIYLPHVAAIKTDTFATLASFVDAGGRVVADVPYGLADERGRLIPVGAGSDFERLFGVELRDFQHANTVTRLIDGAPVRGRIAELEVTDARVLERFETGEPAVTEHDDGAGSAAYVAFEASAACHRPGATAMEARLAALALGDADRRWRSSHPTTYRLAAPGAHHYFITNAGAERQVTIDVADASYDTVADAVDGGPIESTGDTVRCSVPARGGRWLRAVLE